MDEGQDHFVRVETRYGDPRREGPARFAHPLVLRPDEWAGLLTRIKVQSYQDSFVFTTAKNPPADAFEPNEIAYLSAKLSEAFSRAFPDEWVVFGLSRTRAAPLTEITTGGWFVEGTTLHLILANYRHGVIKAGVREQLWKDPLRSDTKLYVEILPGEAMTVGKGKLRLSGLMLTEGAELFIDYKKLLETMPAIQPAAQPRPTAPSPTPPNQSVEDRLRALKGLRDQGLITEDEYREKKKQVLESF
jgi:hypothetical protein